MPARCVARSDLVRLVATREIITNLTIQIFDELPLDVSAIPNDTNALVDNLVNVRMVGVSLKASKKTSTRLLKTGKDLREITQAHKKKTVGSGMETILFFCIFSR